MTAHAVVRPHERMHGVSGKAAHAAEEVRLKYMGWYDHQPR